MSETITTTYEMINTADGQEVAEEVQPARFKLHATQERLERMKWGVYRQAQTSPQAQTDFIASFMIRPNGAEIPRDEAQEILDDMSMAEVAELFERLGDALQDTAAPKV